MPDASPNAEPSEWLVTNAALLPASGAALDVACGRGRNAFWLASRGLAVHAVDRDESAVSHVRAVASAAGLTIDAHVQDLEVGPPDLGQTCYDAIVAVHYLHRPLFPYLIAALRPGGLLIYETFTQAQARRGKPKNPAFLLEPGELRALTAGLTILAWREGEFGGRDVASIVCRKP